MTIDEQIKFCEEKIENIKLKAEPQTFADIKASLEELKYYQEMNEKNPFLLDMYKHDKEVINKAIDGFINAYYKYCENQYGRLADDEIADMGKVKEKLVK